MLHMDDYAYASRLSAETPGNKLFFGVLSLCICLGANSFAASVLTILVMGAVSVHFSGIRFSRYLSLLSIPFGFLVIGTVTIMVSGHPAGHEMLLGVSIGTQVYGVDAESLRYGMNLILRALAAVSCMYFISLNTPMCELLQTLRRLHMPVILVSLMELIYRYIFVLTDEMRRMRTAQSSRLGYRNFKTSVSSTGSLIAMLFLRAYTRCDRIYSALESRGYEGEIKMLGRTCENHRVWIWGGALFGVLLVLAAAAERSLF